MTVSKGQPWGAPSPLPPSAAVASCDRDAARYDVVGVVGGDLCRTLGGPGSRARLTSPDATMFPVDALSVSLDGGAPMRAVAHVVARSWGWRHVFIAANAQWAGELNIAPRAHPGDGLVDTVAWDLDWRSARQVLARMRLGAHLPHPGVSTASLARASVTFPAPRQVHVDGVRAGRARALSITVEPDALRVVV